ncbi:hypothetical protein SESBI_28846 [Sesbania bispinosa]|nr:hypothetical protein SESBI_28846 [Sesbania bispinosa]
MTPRVIVKLSKIIVVMMIVITVIPSSTTVQPLASIGHPIKDMNQSDELYLLGEDYGIGNPSPYHGGGRTAPIPH